MGPLLNRTDQSNDNRFPPDKPSSHVRIMSANVAGKTNLISYDKPDIWNGMRIKIIAIFKRYKPDILALQESYFYFITHLLKNTDIPYAIRGSLCFHELIKDESVIASQEYSDRINYCKHSHSDENKEYTPILYNTDTMTYQDGGFYLLEPTKHKIIPVSDGALNCGSGNPIRIVTWVLLQHKETNKLWLIQNAHFNSSKTSSYPACIETVKSNTDRIVTEQSSMNRKPHTVIFTGDLNLFPKHDGQKFYEQFNASFRDVRDLSQRHYGPDGTWIGKSTLDYLFAGDPYTPPVEMERLDHMFIKSDEIDVVGDAVIGDNPCLENLDQNPYPLHRPPLRIQKNQKRPVPKLTDSPSDHLFIAADFAPKVDSLVAMAASMQISS